MLLLRCTSQMFFCNTKFSNYKSNGTSCRPVFEKLVFVPGENSINKNKGATKTFNYFHSSEWTNKVRMKERERERESARERETERERGTERRISMDKVT